ncbi:MAG: TRAP transporter fused permease subunit [Rhodospirillaceae bacterium]|nr:TRAP transporter fused permease subunit [Rhodospirillaceae bacterium]MBT7955155.1 TRAP transporter fused permease subunit [Rhodospirillaceae bacterium]
MNEDSSTDASTHKNTATSGFIAVLAVVLTLAAITWAADVFRLVGLLLYTEQFLSGILAIAVPLVFLSVRAKKSQKGDSIPWYDYVFSGIGFICASFMAVRYPALAELVSDAPIEGLIPGTIIVILLIEGLRRTVGHTLTVLVLIFVLIGLFGHLLPGKLAGKEMLARDFFYYLAWDSTSILGVPMKIVTSIVMAFVFFGQVLTKSGGSTFFTEISMVLVGRYRGGQAKIAVTASGFFGSISGSVVSNVVTTGVITIPMMRNAGYRGVQAGAIEAVASTGGQLMPPIMGAAAFLMAEFLEIPYKEVVVAALIPAILYYVALFILADLEAARTNIKPVDEKDIPKFMDVLKTGWYFPLPFVVLIMALFVFNYSPEMSALISVLAIIATSMIFGYKGKRLTFGDLLAAVRQTGHAVLDIIMIAAAAGIVIGTLNVTGVGFGMSLMMVELGDNNLFLLLLISAFVCIFLGMGMPTVAVYLMLATLVAPSLIEVGIDPMAAHLFILYFGMMSMITPPVAIAAFAAASLTGKDPMATGFAAMRFGWFAYLVPFLFVVVPELLMRGDAISIFLVTGKSILGIWFVSVAVMGYAIRHISPLMRVLFAIAGAGMFVPDKILNIGIPLALIGIVLGGALIALDWTRNRQASPT